MISDLQQKVLVFVWPFGYRESKPSKVDDLKDRGMILGISKIE